jgi:hypothetical protein
MDMQQQNAFLASVTVLALALFLVDAWFTVKKHKYDRLILESECDSRDHPCKADFDGDGQLTPIQIIRHADSYVDLPPKLADGQELIRLNVRSIDSTDRTHVAVSNETGAARLLIYDGSCAPQLKAVVMPPEVESTAPISF